MTDKKTKAITPVNQAQAAIKAYMTKGVVGDFSAIPVEAKLQVTQVIPGPAIKERNIGGKMCKYVPGKTAQSILNFIFNFDISMEVVEKKIAERSISTKKGTMKVYDAVVEVKFTFYNHTTKREIVRTVFSTHLGYENKAQSQRECLKAALTKSWTVVARTFGIGADLDDQPEYIDPEEPPVVEQKQPAGKDFDF